MANWLFKGRRTANRVVTQVEVTGNIPFALDPICGQDVFEQAECSYRYNELRYYFCSHRCRTMFVANPARYAQRKRVWSADPAGSSFPSTTLEQKIAAADRAETPGIPEYDGWLAWVCSLVATAIFVAMFGYFLGWFDRVI